MNTAEATIIFDNAERRLPIDTPEVHVTRRVYRSGEGEYMINGQPCRLRDVKYMFSGTGVMARFDAKAGKEFWRVDTLKEFDGRNIRWGMSCSPLIDPRTFCCAALTIRPVPLPCSP